MGIIPYDAEDFQRVSYKLSLIGLTTSVQE